MNKYLLSTAFISLLFFSCRKTIEDRIVGTWKLVSSYKQRTFDRDHFTTGYEQGIFTFNENGTATYARATDTLTGFWSADKYSVSNYNASSGQTDTKGFRELKIELVHFMNNRYLFWEFDDFNFRDNWREIRAKEFSLSNDRIYEFRRQ
jgi:hypothetical protein